ncbi:type III-A CRISPR-associated protein Cas10/Csm1 [Paenibacillus elgii]|uniref:type III-A CRISPR-associated protein Cas10/Csm1 n=1 Tax=Paenibacillus elgii TaxID=189691 RepID=UPI000248D941|nr:type III-A CRISPR-associated protein Cas10/Csm1 [Paenibacillus elgii]
MKETIVASYYYLLYRILGHFLPDTDFKAHVECIRQQQKAVQGERVLQILEQLQEDHKDQTIPSSLREALATLDIMPENDAGSLRRLSSVFCYIELEQPYERQAVYDFAELSERAIFPKEVQGEFSTDPDAYIQKFANSLNRLWSREDQSYEAFFIKLKNTVEHYAWCIASGSKLSHQYVPVSEQCSMLGALAAALVSERMEDSGQMTLVVGDLSGIQKYIFDIAQTGAGSVAKRLRARSFFLSALSDVISHRIVHRFGLPLSNIVMSSGGKFYILLPGGTSTLQELERLQKELDHWFLEQYHGELACNLAGEVIIADDLLRMDKVMERLSLKLRQRKMNPLLQGLTAEEHWDTNSWLIQQQETGRRCSVCKKFAVDEGDLCKNCRFDEEMGQRLVRARYFVYRYPSRRGLPVLDRYSVEAVESLPTYDESIYLVYKLNSPAVDTDDRLPIVTKYTANYIPVADENGCPHCLAKDNAQDPVRPGAPLQFECIAESAIGAKQLAYLKADVDYLGSVFVFGLNRDGQAVQLQQIAVLSKMLDLFFSGWVHGIISEKYRRVYTVFSGGDDLLLIGAWDEIVCLAQELHLRFREFVGDNPNLTLSAGITFCKFHQPVARQAAVAEEELDRAKESPSRTRPEGRNQVAVLQQAMNWKQFAEFCEEAKRLAAMWEQKQVSSAFLYRLLDYAEMYRTYEAGDTQGLRFYPKLAYDIARNLSDEKDKEIRIWAQRFLTIQEDHPLLTLRPLIQMSRLYRLNDVIRKEEI